MANKEDNKGCLSFTNIFGVMVLVAIGIVIAIIGFYRHHNQWPQGIDAVAANDTQLGIEMNLSYRDSTISFPVREYVDTLTVYTMERAEMHTDDGKLVRGRFLDSNVILLNTENGKELTKRSLNIKAQKLRDRGYYFLSESRLKEASLGRSLEEVDGMYRIADCCMPVDSGHTEAFFLYLAMITDEGDFFNVRMHFDKDNRCTEVERYRRLDSNNRWLLSILPLSQTILSWDWLTWLIQESPNGTYQPDGMWILKMLSALFFWIVSIVWFILPPMVPLALFYAVTPMSKMKWLSNDMLSVVASLIGFVGCYVWVVGLLAWGMHWLFSIFFVVEMVVVIILLGVSVPIGERCPQCRSVGRFEVVSTRLVRNEILNTTEFVDVGYDSYKERYEYEYQDYNHIKETKWGYGNKETETTPYRDTIRVKYKDIYHKYDAYGVKYKTPVYIDKYKCKDCGYTKEGQEYKGTSERIESKYLNTVVRRYNTVRLSDQIVKTEQTGRTIIS
ncbi:MAG: hypothetical protein K6F89_00035 [Prevotella sp.]|nr:hypothetical protein [Prevotella sp.]